MDTNLEQNQTEYLKTKTVLDSYDNQDYVLIPTGKGYVDTFIINGFIPVNKRHRTLQAIAVANIYNNPTIGEPNLLARLLNINKEFCKPPLSYFEVSSIHNEIYNLHTDRKLLDKRILPN